MTFNEAIGVNSYGVDIKTGAMLSHSEKYRRIIEYLGGLETVSMFIPFSNEQVKEALQTDQHLNNLNIHRWDEASGYWTSDYRSKGVPEYFGGGLWALLHDRGITVASPAECVCVLKEAAVWRAEEF